MLVTRGRARNMICGGGRISFRGGQIRARKQYLAHLLVCFSLFQNWGHRINTLFCMLSFLFFMGACAPLWPLPESTSANGMKRYEFVFFLVVIKSSIEEKGPIMVALMAIWKWFDWSEMSKWISSFLLEHFWFFSAKRKAVGCFGSLLFSSLSFKTLLNRFRMQLPAAIFYFSCHQIFLTIFYSKPLSRILEF